MATSEAIIPHMESTATLSCPVSERKSTGEGIEKREWSIGIGNGNFWWRMSGFSIAVAYMIFTNTRCSKKSPDRFGIMGFIGGSLAGTFLGPFTVLLAHAHFHGLEQYHMDTYGNRKTYW
jgi:hypothetical protein